MIFLIAATAVSSAAPSPPGGQCTVDSGTTYLAPAHYSVASGVTSADGCCTACASQPRCMSWTYNRAKGKGCFLRPGVPTQKTAKAGVTSGVVGNRPAPPGPPPSPAPPGALNVLLFAVDDLRRVGRLFGEPEALMPNLDALAARSTIFTNAFVQAATCGVSRTSLLTSRRPDTTQVTENGGCPFTNNPAHANWVSKVLEYI